MWTPEPTAQHGLHFNVDTLKELMKPSTRLVAVNFPHNPSGFVPSSAAWDAIVDAVKVRNSLIQ
jgi:aspartate/methionine/tyrosine aminotransferase